MLKSLYISNYALIDSLEISFPDGLVIITGETGAGKSILLGALSLLLGAKADKEILKDTDKNCVVEAIFSLNADDETNTLFEESSIDYSNEITLRRVVSPGGKTRSFVNDQPVGIQFLKILADKIIDIHAQHEHLLISDSRFQLTVLDSFANNFQLLTNYRTVFEKLKDLERQRGELLSKISQDEQEHEYITFQFNQLCQANLIPGELEEIESEYAVLSNAEEIKSWIVKTKEILNYADISLVQNLREIVTILEKISQNLSKATELAKRAEVCRIELKDIESEIEKLSDTINISPERASILEERIALINDLLRKHRTDSVEKLISIKEELSSKLETSGNDKELLESINNSISQAVTERDRLAEELTLCRKNVSGEFAAKMRDSIRDLEMPYAQFNVIIKQRENYDQYGKDDLFFTFSANKNIPERDLSKVASGGELSRIMLCLKSVMAKGTGMPTLIFDEIDSGVSGSIADKMGSLIGDLSQNMQVFAITHLPQIASKGKCHLLVFKDLDSSGKATTKIKKITGDERILEIARMLSGSQLTGAAVANAKEFLRLT